MNYLINQGQKAFETKIKDEKANIHYVWITIFIAFFIMFFAVINRQEETKEQEINYRMEKFAERVMQQNVCFRDSLQHFVDTSLTINFNPSNK